MEPASIPRQLMHETAAAPGALRCVVCNAPRTEAERFCTACGCEAEAPATHCAHCNFPARSGARFCIRCGTKVPEDAISSVRSPAGNPIVQSPAATSRAVPIGITVLGCALAIGVYLSLQVGGTRSHDASIDQHGAAERGFATGTLGRTRANTEDFSVRRALTDLYGNYDPNLDGAFWRAAAAPPALAGWENRTLFIRPLISRSFEDRGRGRHILVTNSLDVRKGEIVKQGTGCRLCGSLIGAAIFERSDQEWKLISRHDFLTAGGRWGAPPRVSIDFPASGTVRLRFDRFAGDSREGSGNSYSIVLKERERSKALALPVSGHDGSNRARTPQP